MAAVSPAQFLQPLQERHIARLTVRIIRGRSVEHADAPHPLGLLGASGERPPSAAAEQRDELAPSQLIKLHSVPSRSEEHTSELQSLRHLVCRLLLDNKNISCV